MAIRNPRYTVDISYITTGGKYFGKLESPILMTKENLDLALKMTNPLKSIIWMREINNLPRGGFYRIESINGAEEAGECLKVITVTRN